MFFVLLLPLLGVMWTLGDVCVCFVVWLGFVLCFFLFWWWWVFLTVHFVIVCVFLCVLVVVFSGGNPVYQYRDSACA